MKKGLEYLHTLACIVVSIAFAPLAGAATFDWSGASGLDLFWVTPGNWSPSGPPGTSDDARFFNPGAVADATIDSTLTTSTTVQRLWFGQTNGPNHNLMI